MWYLSRRIPPLIVATATCNLATVGSKHSRVLAMSTLSSKTVAVAQLCSTSDKVSNLLQIARCAGWAKASKAEMLFLPEACGFIGENAKQTYLNAEQPISGDSLRGQVTEPTNDEHTNPTWLTKALQSTVANSATNIEPTKTPEDPKLDNVELSRLSVLNGLQTIARASQMWISVGGLHVQVDDSSDKVYNTHLILDDQGRIQAIYRKIHLFDVSIPGKVQLKESNSTAPGTEVVLCDTPVGRMGLTTCYDMRFPELYIKLLDQGAQVMLVPSAFTVPTGKAHWHILLRARAIESQCFVIAAAQYGKHNAKRESYGHSLVVDPWGVVLGDAGGVDSLEGDATPAPSIVTCELDFDKVDSVRERLPIQQHRKAADY